MNRADEHSAFRIGNVEDNRTDLDAERRTVPRNQKRKADRCRGRILQVLVGIRFN
jgi:hypothetical protein